MNSYKHLLTAVLALLVASMLHAQTGTSEAWATNSSKRMEHQDEQALTATTNASVRIVLRPGQTYQTVDGFGWMLNQGSAKLLKQLHSTVRRSILEELFGTDGLRASMVRVAIGACDLSESDYTYAESKDETLANFAIAQQDLTTVIPVLQEILAINPQVKVLAVPWTAPVWMKQSTRGNSGYTGGTLKSAYYDLYADYLIRYIDAMASYNIPVWGISVQNEPLNGNNNPSMEWSKEYMYKFIAGNLGPKLSESKYHDVRIIAYDHNCDVTDYPVYVAKSKYVYGTAFHLYAGDISALGTVYNSTGKPVLFTEQYTGKGGDFAGDLNWHMQNVVIGSLCNMSTTTVEWNLCSDPNCSIHTAGGCDNCLGALTVNGGKVSARNVSYYIIGHASRVVDQGAVRIGASSSASNIAYAAFRNPDGSIGVIAYNNSDQSRSLAVALPDQDNQTVYAGHTLPAKGALSVRIRPANVTALHTPDAAMQPVKRMKNGQLLIDRQGQSYSIIGQKL